MPSALSIVQKFFPKVESLRDGSRPINVEVTKHDASSAKSRSHNECAVALACKRKLHLDGVVVSRSVAYLVKGTQATRYHVPESVTREVVALDRGGTFSPGEYKLIPPAAYAAIGVRKPTGKKKPKKSNHAKGERYHHTTGIRAALSGVPQ